MKMKFLASIGVVSIISSLLGTSSLANDSITQNNLYNYFDELSEYNINFSLTEFLDIAQFAYLEMDSVTESMKEIILDSREKIIFNTTWTIDNSCWTYDSNGNRVDLPDFYDLFPSDWEVPAKQDDNIEIASFADLARTTVLFDETVSISYAGSQNTKDFHTWHFAYPHYTTIRATSIPGSTYNVGFTNNGVSIGWLANQTINSAGLTTYLAGSEDDTYGARASTYSTPGDARMLITYE